MQTDFAHYQGELVRRQPALAATLLAPTAAVCLSGTELWSLLFDAFGHGVVHHAAVTARLGELAIEEAERQTQHSGEPQGPAALKPHFDEIFGQAKAG